MRNFLKNILSSKCVVGVPRFRSGQARAWHSATCALIRAASPPLAAEDDVATPTTKARLGSERTSASKAAEEGEWAAVLGAPEGAVTTSSSASSVTTCASAASAPSLHGHMAKGVGLR